MTPLAAAATAAELAESLGAQIDGRADVLIRGFDAIEHAVPGTLTFIRSAKFASAWSTCRASAALVTRGIDIPGHDPQARALLIVDDADRALATILAAAQRNTRAVPGVHATASVDPSAHIAASACIGPGCVVDADATVADGARLVANVFVGARVRVGPDTTLMPGVNVMHDCRIGARCILHPGVVVGADGFGYAPAHNGSGPIKIPHAGGVAIGDDVEIGANTTIDRAKIGDTSIGRATKIDNLCQIAHGCTIGAGCVVCGLCGLSGSVTLGDGVMLGGGVGISDNVTIGPGARIGAGSGVMNDVPAGESWIGAPAAEAGVNRANYAVFRRLADLARDVKKLNKRAAENGQ